MKKLKIEGINSRPYGNGFLHLVPGFAGEQSPNHRAYAIVFEIAGKYPKLIDVCHSYTEAYRKFQFKIK